MIDERREFEFLMQQLRQGTPEASRRLVEEYGKYILRAVRRRLSHELRTQFDSMDFVQDVWASFCTIPPECYNFQQPEDLIRFLADLAANKVTDAYRQRFQAWKNNRNRTRSLDGSATVEAFNLIGDQPTPSQDLMNREQVDRLLQDQPPEVQRVLLLLTSGRTQQEIADELGVNVRTVRRLLESIRSQTARRQS
jgi:RNA polymerase sigma factor (sigma-70 family)